MDEGQVGDSHQEEDLSFREVVVFSLGRMIPLCVDVQIEILKFGEMECKHMVVFEGLSCFAHTVQLVIAKFNEDRKVAAVVKRVMAVVRSVSV